MGQLATGAVFGAVFGALIAGFLKMVGDWISQASSRRALAAGFTAEISVGVKAITTVTSVQNSKDIVRFLAVNGIPYEFYAANTGRLGELGAKIAFAIVDYYSTRWQFFKANDLLDSAGADRFGFLVAELRRSGQSALDLLQPQRS